MILQMITDRHRLAPGAAPDEALACLTTQARAAVSAGIDLIQVRERDLEARALATVVRALLAVTRGTRTRLVVNERLDVALACGADGVHLRGTSFAAIALRSQVPSGFLIGRSIRSAEEAASAGPVDYLVAGTVWSTASKPPGHPLLGLDGLARVCAASRAPVLAVGGVTTASAAAMARAGAAGAAMIGAFIGRAPGRCRAERLDGVVSRLRDAFDTAGGGT